MNTDFKYTLEYYELLESNAKPEIMDGIELLVFRGSVTKLWRSLGISGSYYSKVTDALKALGCITVVQRGARGIDSVLTINHAPDEMEFLIFSRAPLTPASLHGKLAERMDEYEKRLGGMDIVEAFKYVDERLDELDRRVKFLEQNGKAG